MWKKWEAMWKKWEALWKKWEAMWKKWEAMWKKWEAKRKQGEAMWKKWEATYVTRKKCKLCDAKTGSYLKKFRKPCNKNGIHMKKWDYVKKADSCMKKEGVEICDEKKKEAK